ncbi:MAG: branched-chain amino acid ABC transporter permease [Christensenellales bacterium]
MTKFLKKYWGYILFFVIMVLYPDINKVFFNNNSYYQTLFDLTLVNVIIVLGMNFVTGLVGQMNMGMAGVFACGAYTSAVVTVKLGIDPWLSLFAAIAMGLVIGVMLGWPSLRVKGIYLALTTIGFGEIVRLLASNLPDLTGGTQGLKDIPKYNLFGLKFDNIVTSYYLLLAFTIIAIILAMRICNSKWGRAFVAIRDNDEAIESSGINIAEVKIKAFICSTVFACVAGALYAHFSGYITPTNFTTDYSAKYVMMLMIGGIGSVPGVVIGAFVITQLPEYLRFMSDFYLLVFAVIGMLFAIFVPNGIVSVTRPIGKFIGRLFNKTPGKDKEDTAAEDLK